MNGMNVSRRRFWQLLRDEMAAESMPLPSKLAVKISARDEEGTNTHFLVLSQGRKVGRGIYSEATGSVEYAPTR